MVAKKLQGQVAIVSGASRGIGRVAAARLASNGAAVVLAARDEEAVIAGADALTAAGHLALGVGADVADLEQVEALIERTLERFRRVDILVNNAAVVWPLEEIADADPDEWAYNIHVNLIAPFYLTRGVLPLMLDQGHGRIINVGSGAAHHPISGASAYCAAKAGLEMFTRTLAAELKETGVIVAGFDPGGVDTDMQADIRSVDTDETILDFAGFHAAKAQGALRPPEAIAPLVLWLAGPWNREQGRLFRADDGAWQQQVARDIPSAAVSAEPGRSKKA